MTGPGETSEENLKVEEGKQLRERVAPVPKGLGRFPWYGPGLLWMVSSVGSGSILFTPRVGSRYGYELLWAAFFVAFLTWVIIREIGRYTVVSGKTILEGYHGLPGPKGWAVWLIFLPGLVSGVVVVAGIAALVGSALAIVIPVSHAVSSLGIILLSAALVVSGRYRKLEMVTAGMAFVLVVSTFATAVAVFPGWDAYAGGMAPSVVQDFDPPFVIPWIGFLLAGAAGMMWYSYWVAARGYGGLTDETLADAPDEAPGTAGESARGGADLRRWIAIMSVTAAIGVIGATLVNVSFLTLGAELLRPLGIIPQGIRVAEDLLRLLSDVWGAAGMWLLMAGMFVALWGSIIANQDGWGRMYADATIMLMPGLVPKRGGTEHRAAFRRRLRTGYILLVLTALPCLLYLILRDPVTILSVGGIISAAHLPVMVTLTLILNLRRLPSRLGPGPVWTGAALIAILFYAAVSVYFFFDLLRS
jgi:Mn2+/Fe2+ NRAMP family transporter